MAGLEGYTGPTSGRITIGGSGETKRERFYDKPLTAEERKAVEWFTALSPHEQLREVRRLKWNLEEVQRDGDVWREVARRQDRENARLEAERDARRPDGYELPRAVAELLAVSAEWGWGTARRWTLGHDGLAARLELGIARGGWQFKLAWTVPVNGNGRGARDRAGLARRPGRDWYDAPSLKEIRRLLMTDPD